MVDWAQNSLPDFHLVNLLCISFLFSPLPLVRCVVDGYKNGDAEETLLGVFDGPGR